MKGLKARGGFVVDIQWKDGKLQRAVVVSANGGNLRIASAVPLKGKGVKPAKGPNSNPIYALDAAPVEKISNPDAVHNTINSEMPYVYDISTKAGQVVTLEGKYKLESNK